MTAWGISTTPCYNPAHHHPHPFVNHGLEADLGMLAATRDAMRTAAPNALGHDKLLSSEGFADLFHMHEDTAFVSWVGWPEDNDISPARITMPWYIGSMYPSFENAGRAAMDGWNLGRVELGEEVGWNMLRHSFAKVYSTGMVTATDPVAVGAPSLGLRLYDADEFYLLIAAPGVAGPVPATSEPATVRLPVTVPAGTVGLQTAATTLVSSEVTVGAGSTLTVPGVLSTTIVPKLPNAELGFVTISPSLPLALPRGGSIVLRVALLSPWQVAPSAVVGVSAFGLDLNATRLSLAPVAFLRVAAPATAALGPHLLRLEASGSALPSRRWINVTAAGAGAQQ